MSIKFFCKAFWQVKSFFICDTFFCNYCISNCQLNFSKVSIVCSSCFFLYYFQPILEQHLQLNSYDDEKPYASPTTHFELSLSSRYNLSRLRDNGGNSLLSSNFLVHVGEIVSKVNNISTFRMSLSFTYDFFICI